MTIYWASRKLLLLPLKTGSDFLRSAPSTCSFDFFKLVTGIADAVTFECEKKHHMMHKYRKIHLKNVSFCSLTSRAESRIMLGYRGPYIAHDCMCLRTGSVTNPHTEKLPRASRKWILLLLAAYAFSSTSFPILHSQISGNAGTLYKV